MGDIYQGASLTAAVTKSSEPSQGCFTHLLPRFRGYALQPPANSTFPLITVREVLPHDHSQHGYMIPDREKVPLLFRGWVLQERLLSRRILQFTSEELGWECLTSRSCECDRDPHGTPGFKEGVSLAINTGSPAELYPQWSSLVEQYTTMGLTFLGGRLPAIAGLAAKFQHRLDDTYVSGVWAGNVHESLSWIVLDPPVRIQASSQPAAPSWSWASSTVPVRHPYKERWTDGTRVDRAQVSLDEVSPHMGMEKFTTATHFIRITAPSVSGIKTVQLDDFHARDPYSENPYSGKKYGIATGGSPPRVIFPDFHPFDGPCSIPLDEEFCLAKLRGRL
ncbi:uncharacterized protein DNG_00071 [Cephalotrichum gorgonifer]|uniref:Heterokaryon incompatibility domain-containing protein n=1 Tax=Cephalotrichum gorgonifer TaxID=2041049 RepID=A0AAE8MQJ9_9PEZI|nr:uncharacterized protein DNG_00071 [Cephalotrichum gorgonifer]